MLRYVTANACGVFLAVALLIGAASVTPTSALAAEDQAVSPEVTVHLKAAQKALTKKEWPSVLAEIDKADAIKTKTAYDQQIVEQMRTFLRAHWK
jgi:hypothetical protein